MTAPAPAILSMFHLAGKRKGEEQDTISLFKGNSWNLHLPLLFIFHWPEFGHMARYAAKQERKCRYYVFINGDLRHRKGV